MPYDLDLINTQEQTLVLPTFTSTTAWSLGSALRTHLSEAHPTTPTVIAIFAGSTEQLYFFATAGGEGSTLDNKSWVERKRRSVARWGVSTARLNVKYADKGLPEKYGTKEEDYATHGGGFPLRVQGVEPLVGIVVVSGLKQEDDHGVICEVLEKFIKEQK